MLGPVDVEGWRDDAGGVEEGDAELRARLDGCAAIIALRKNPALSALPGLSRSDFELARAYACGERLSGELIRFLARRLNARAQAK